MFDYLIEFKVTFCVQGVVSPLLANIYLHYALDLWLDQWRRRRARGEVIFVRYADDFVLGFQYRSDAEKCLTELRERLRRFNLELHDDKTRLIEFGRFATQNRKQRGQGKPATFSFLGFTHICGKTQKGKFVVWRLTMRKRLVAKLKQIKAELRRRMHLSIPVVGQWLKRILQGHYNYYGVPLNYRAMATFRHEVSRLWFRTLRRRSQKSRLNWDRMSRLEKAGSCSLKSDILILSNAYASLPKAGAQCGSPARWDLSGGRRVTGVPTGIVEFATQR